MKKIIDSNGLPKTIGHYSQAIEAGGFVFCSGQIGVDHKTNKLATGIEAQTKQALNNLREVLKSAGIDFTCVAKMDVFLSNMNDFQKMNDIYGSFFQSKPPARQTVEVSALPQSALIEISCIAFQKE